MPMRLDGSCKCGAVTFSVESSTPCPYQLCYCSICRKAGTGGYAINIGADFKTLKVQGVDHIRAYTAVDGACDRSFCGTCATMLWVWDARWPELMHPFASAIDSDLPEPPERVHMMLGSKADWVQPDIRPSDQTFDEYPALSLEDWHKSRALWVA